MKKEIERTYKRQRKAEIDRHRQRKRDTQLVKTEQRHAEKFMKQKKELVMEKKRSSNR